MSGSQRPIIVLGVDRSGTSLIANLIVRWGAFPGEQRFVAYADKSNPRGFWEYRPMESFLADLFDCTKVSQWDPSLQDRLCQCAFVPEIRSRVKLLIQEMEAAGRPWMWKEPYLSLSLSFWELFWTNPIYVIALRNPLDSSASYEKFRLPLMLQGRLHLTCLFLVRWQFFLLSILDHVASHPSSLFISYDELLRDPREGCERLCRFLDRECGLPDDATRSARMAEVIDPALWHHRAEQTFLDSPIPTREQKELYEHLLRRLNNPRESFDRALYPIGAAGLEYLKNFDLMTSILQPSVSSLLHAASR